MARVKAEYALTVNIFAKLFLGYRLESQSLVHKDCFMDERPSIQAWHPYKHNAPLTEPARIRANGLFCSTAEIDVYPRDEMVRTPERRDTYILQRGAKRHIGALTLTRR